MTVTVVKAEGNKGTKRRSCGLMPGAGAEECNGVRLGSRRSCPGEALNSSYQELWTYLVGTAENAEESGYSGRSFEFHILL